MAGGAPRRRGGRRGPGLLRRAAGRGSRGHDRPVAGSGLPTGSPLDGLLEAYGWYGKEFLDADTVHPLLFRDRTGAPRPVDPALLPMSVLRDYPRLAPSPVLRRVWPGVRPLLYTDKPKARLRAMDHRGVRTAAMVYDGLPIIDAFRHIGPDLVLGLMDLRGRPRPSSSCWSGNGPENSGGRKEFGEQPAHPRGDRDA